MGGERGGGGGMNGKPRFTLASNDIQGRFLGKKVRAIVAFSVKEMSDACKKKKPSERFEAL